MLRQAAFDTAVSMGYSIEEDVIAGPDGYRFRVLQREAGHVGFLTRYRSGGAKFIQIRCSQADQEPFRQLGHGILR